MYDSKATDLMRGVRNDEREQLHSGASYYNDDQVRQAIVHSRQDIVLMVSYLSSLNAQIMRLTRALWLIAGLLLVSLVVQIAR